LGFRVYRREEGSSGKRLGVRVWGFGFIEGKRGAAARGTIPDWTPDCSCCLSSSPAGFRV
jgi:hypothetical protein